MTAVPVLLYHSVAEDCDPRFAEWAVTPATFAAHMALLAEAGYTAVTVPELVERRSATGVVAVTFDDGFADNHAVAWPILAEFGLTATVYVTTGCAGATSRWLDRLGEGDRPLMSWEQIRELAAAGIEIGAHGETHVQLDTVAPARARAEIERSRDALAAAVGLVRTFAYPHGYHHRRVRRQVADAGFGSACAVGDGLARLGDDPYAIRRVIVREHTDLERVLAGAEPPRGDRALRRAAWRLARRAGAERLLVPA